MKKAFTLIEILVVVGLIGIITLILSGIFANGSRQYRMGLKRILLNEKAAQSVDDFEKITRGATSIILAEPNNLVFLAYLKADTHPAPSKINYYLEDKKLYRSIIPPVVNEGVVIYQENDKTVKTIADSVISTNLFAYFNDSNTELAFPVQNDVVRMVKISIEIDDNPDAFPESAKQATGVQLRNLKNNL